MDQQAKIVTRRLRQSLTSVVGILDELDADMERRPAEARGETRYRYRAKKLHLETRAPSGDMMRYEAVSRNISASGVSLVVGQVVYPGTPCAVQLISIHNYWQTVSGRVMRCNYLPGSMNLHEIGVQFDVKIDVARFHREAGKAEVLLLTSESTLAGLLLRLSGEQPLSINEHSDIDSLVKTADNTKFEMALLDCEIAELANSVQKLRSHGFVRPIIALYDEDKPPDDLDIESTLRKPLCGPDVSRVVVSSLDEPLVSTLLHETAMTDLIDQFVFDLKRVANDLTDALREKDADKLRQLLRRLRGSAASYGFEAISERSGKVMELLAAEKSSTFELRQLIRWCLAAQPVSCSAGDLVPSAPGGRVRPPKR